MSDEFPRPTQGRSPDRHPDSTPPTWWGELERRDLPDPSRPRRLSDLMRAERPGPLPEAPVAAADSRQWRSFGVGLLVIVVAVLIGVVALGSPSLRGIEVAALVLGVPAVLATAVVLVITRRSDEG
ncbi:MAG: hypothetical protein NVSMB29_05180 [Candidatus Dormibacteria bacterium]